MSERNKTINLYTKVDLNASLKQEEQSYRGWQAWATSRILYFIVRRTHQWLAGANWARNNTDWAAQDE
jgi:hypothetical protein